MSNEERREKRYQRRKAKREAKKREKIKKLDDYNILLNPNTLLESFNECKKNVKWKGSTQKYELNLLSNIYETIEELKNNKLVSKGFVCFTLNERGKERYIQSPHISERVVQKALCNNILIPILSRTLIYDSGASLKGKGTSFTRKRLIKHLNSYRIKNGTNGYVLIMDFSKYFDNIDHQILMSLLKKHVKDERVINLCEQAISEFGEKGLGLGSQISQILSVFFCSSIDHLVKDHYGIKYYGRYMDDCYIISNNKNQLKNILLDITSLCKKMNIKINKNKTFIISLNKGFTFLKCKYKFSKTGKILKLGGKESVNREIKKINKLKLKNVSTKKIIEMYKSWRGTMKNFDSYKLVKKSDRLIQHFFIS